MQNQGSVLVEKDPSSGSWAMSYRVTGLGDFTGSAPVTAQLEGWCLALAWPFLPPLGLLHL